MSQLIHVALGDGIVLVDLEIAATAVEDLVLALGDDVLFELAESLRGAAGAHEGTADNHVAFTLLHVGESVLQLKYLIAMPALDPYLVNNIVEVPVLLFRVKHTLALAALGAALVQPLLDAIPMEYLLAIAALHRPKRYTQANRANEGVHEASVLLFDVFFAQPIALFEHKFDQVTINSLHNFLRLMGRIFFEHGYAILVLCGSHHLLLLLILLKQLAIVCHNSGHLGVCMRLLAFDHFDYYRFDGLGDYYYLKLY